LQKKHSVAIVDAYQQSWN